MKILYLGLLLFVAISCKKEAKVGVDVTVGNFSGEIEMDSIISDVYLLGLNIPDTNFIGEIRDMAISNDSIYILDQIKQSLFIFDIHGNFIQEVCRSGRAGEEYINACSIECDSMYVYILDMPGRKLLIYDRLLNFVAFKNLPHSSSDFKIVGKQFVFNNIEDFDGNYGYIHMDADLKIVGQYLPYQQKLGQTLHGRGPTGYMISWDKILKRVLLVRPFSNQVYGLTPGEELQLLYQIDFGRNTIPEYIKDKHFDFTKSNFIYIEDFFDLEQYKIVSFFEKDKRYYCLFSPEMKALYAGRIKDSKTSLPFFPRWQYGNKLIGTCRGEYIKEYMKQKNQPLSPEETDKNYLIFYSLKSMNNLHKAFY